MQDSKQASKRAGAGPADAGAEPRSRGHSLDRFKGAFIVLGSVWMVLGAAAALGPFLAATEPAALLGGVLAIGGLAQLLQALRCRGWRGFAAQLTGGIGALGVGALLALAPHLDPITPSGALGAFFILHGLLSVVLAFQHRARSSWGWLVFSGMLQVTIGLLMWFAGPSGPLWVLELATGVALGLNGWSLIALAAAGRPGAEGGRGRA